MGERTKHESSRTPLHAEAKDTGRRHRASGDLVATVPDTSDQASSSIPSAPAFRLLIDEMPEGAAMLSADRRVVLYANRALARMLEVQLEELYGQSLHPYLWPIAELGLDDVLSGPDGSTGELELVTASGRHIPVSVTARLLCWDGCSVHGLAITSHGVRREAERLRRTVKALIAAEQRKDEFLAMLGHELRNPLAPILTTVCLLREQVDTLSPNEVRKAVAVIERQVGHMTRLVDDLLDVARITHGMLKLQRQHVELSTLVRTVADTMAALAERHGHVLEVVSQTAEPVYIDADPVRVTEILSNLLQNAIKYTPDGGHITVSLGHEGAWARLSVRDTGTGIAAELLPHLFDAFTQAELTLERSNGGLGLGLALVKRLVELHGGTVCALSPGPGQGSEFVVSLPVLPQEAVRAEPVPADAPPALHHKRILIADDNQDAAEMLELSLTQRGHQVAVAHDGETALTLARSFEPDVLCLDIQLPRLDGCSLARKVREHATKPITLIAVTGYGQEQDRCRTREAGFDYHLVKPIDINELYRLIHAHAG